MDISCDVTFQFVPAVSLPPGEELSALAIEGKWLIRWDYTQDTTFLLVQKVAEFTSTELENMFTVTNQFPTVQF